MLKLYVRRCNAFAAGTVLNLKYDKGKKKDKRSLECKYSLVYSLKQKDTANSKNTGN